MLIHRDLSESLVRPPGIPPSTCRGVLRRVDGGGARIDDDAPPVLDACLCREGDPGRFSAIRLRRCEVCRATVVEATAPDGARHQRNGWMPSTWDRAAARAVDEGEPATVA